MSTTQEIKSQTHRDRNALLITLTAFMIVVLAGVLGFLHYYDAYIDGALYRERLNQMKEVTGQLFTGLETVVQNEWDTVDVYCNYVELGKPGDTQTMLKFLRKQADLNRVEEKSTDIVAVDNLGRYLTQEGWQGTLTEINLLLDYPEKISFVSKSMISDQSTMLFLKRLEEPIDLRDGERTVQIIYYGISQRMEKLNPYFACKAYDDSNSMYVLDELGMRIFNSGEKDLLSGYNAYTVLRNMDYLHGNSFVEAQQELESAGRGYANAVFDGEEYYYALYQMEHSAWTLLFLVPSRYVATEVVGMVNFISWLIMVFAFAMAVVVCLVILAITRYKQRQAINDERQVNARLEELNTRLEAASRAKTEFLSNMSHDIRTPMNAIVGITKLMEHEERDPVKMDAYIRKVQSSSQHLLGLINDVLDMSRIESAEVRLNREPVSLAQQIAQVDSIIRPQAAERDQTFRIYIHGISHEYLIGDSVRLRQIFINLLSNAIKYTPCGGTVTLDVTELPQKEAGKASFLIRVSDTGCGMTPEFMAHIFEPFTRAENSTTNRVQGTGLGMAITKSIVDLKGGTITVQSQVNKGSTFEVILPFTIHADAVPAVDARQVLLLTGDRELAENVSASFRNTSVAFACAANLADARQLLKQTEPDVIVLGGAYSDGSLAGSLAELRRVSHALILCCDQISTEEMLEAVAAAGVDGVLPRPFFFENFARTVNQLRNGSRAGEEQADTGLKGMRFLCAEDNSLNAEILSALLDMEGASCDICSNGRELVDAFAGVKAGDYDAILMDVQMPVMNGLEAARAIRSGDNPLGRTIPIIAMTANAFSSDVQDCLDAGMDAHIPKPLDIAIMERTICALAGKNTSGGGDTCSPVEDS